MHKLVTKVHFWMKIPLTRGEQNILTLVLVIIIYSPNPEFMPSVRKIGDLSCITSCLVLPGFLMDTLLKQSCTTPLKHRYNSPLQHRCNTIKTRLQRPFRTPVTMPREQAVTTP